MILFSSSFCSPVINTGKPFSAITHNWTVSSPHESPLSTWKPTLWELNCSHSLTPHYYFFAHRDTLLTPHIWQKTFPIISCCWRACFCGCGMSLSPHQRSQAASRLHNVPREEIIWTECSVLYLWISNPRDQKHEHFYVFIVFLFFLMCNTFTD